jgi:hypothetical protein
MSSSDFVLPPAQPQSSDDEVDNEFVEPILQSESLVKRKRISRKLQEHEMVLSNLMAFGYEKAAAELAVLAEGHTDINSAMDFLGRYPSGRREQPKRGANKALECNDRAFKKPKLKQLNKSSNFKNTAKKAQTKPAAKSKSTKSKPTQSTKPTKPTKWTKETTVSNAIPNKASVAVTPSAVKPKRNKEKSSKDLSALRSPIVAASIAKTPSTKSLKKHVKTVNSNSKIPPSSTSFASSISPASSSSSSSSSSSFDSKTSRKTFNSLITKFAKNHNDEEKQRLWNVLIGVVRNME